MAGSIENRSRSRRC